MHKNTFLYKHMFGHARVSLRVDDRLDETIKEGELDHVLDGRGRLGLVHQAGLEVCGTARLFGVVEGRRTDDAHRRRV